MNFIINKNSSFYVFISSLSMWNDLFCNRARKKDFIKTVGTLSKKEERALKIFSQVMRKSKVDINSIFLFKGDKAWNILGKKISKNGFVEIKSVFELFSKKFNKIWSGERNKLATIKNELKRRQFQIGKYIKIIEGLSGCQKNKIFNLKIQLLINTEKEVCLGWSLKDGVAIEVSNFNINKNFKEILFVLLHEIFHVMVKKNHSLFNLINQFSQKIKFTKKEKELELWGKRIVFEECLISAFLPEGRLAEIIYNKKEKNNKILTKGLSRLEKLRWYCANKLYKEADMYLKQKNPIDYIFLNKLLLIINNFD